MIHIFNVINFDMAACTEDGMVEWHHWFNGLELGETPRDGEQQGSPGVLQPMGSWTVERDLGTERQQQ